MFRSLDRVLEAFMGVAAAVFHLERRRRRAAGAQLKRKRTQTSFSSLRASLASLEIGVS